MTCSSHKLASGLCELLAEHLSNSDDDLAYTLVDLDGAISEDTLAGLRDIEGVLALRNLGKPLC